MSSLISDYMVILGYGLFMIITIAALTLISLAKNIRGKTWLILFICFELSSMLLYLALISLIRYSPGVTRQSTLLSAYSISNYILSLLSNGSLLAYAITLYKTPPTTLSAFPVLLTQKPNNP